MMIVNKTCKLMKMKNENELLRAMYELLEVKK